MAREGEATELFPGTALYSVDYVWPMVATSYQEQDLESFWSVIYVCGQD